MRDLVTHDCDVDKRIDDHLTILPAGSTVGHLLQIRREVGVAGHIGLGQVDRADEGNPLPVPRGSTVLDPVVVQDSFCGPGRRERVRIDFFPIVYTGQITREIPVPGHLGPVKHDIETRSCFPVGVGLRGVDEDDGPVGEFFQRQCHFEAADDRPRYLHRGAFDRQFEHTGAVLAQQSRPPNRPQCDAPPALHPKDRAQAGVDVHRQRTGLGGTGNLGGVGRRGVVGIELPGERRSGVRRRDDQGSRADRNGSSLCRDTDGCPFIDGRPGIDG